MTTRADARAMVAELARDPARGRVLVESVQLSQSFRAFAEAAWPLIEPMTAFVPGPHLNALCFHLQAVTETHERLSALTPSEIASDVEQPADIRRLLITIPPRMAKSTIVAVLWPAWEWTRNPSLRYLTASYNGDLALRDAVRSRRIITSAWYQERWGYLYAMSSDQNVKGRYENDRSGSRQAVGVGGGATGAGGQRVIVDDPHNLADAHNPRAIAATVQWFTEVMSTRRNDARRDAFVVIQQRVHEHDLAGVLIELGGWTHLNLPMEYAGDDTPTPLGWRDWRTETGEFLAPGRYGAVEKAETVMLLGEVGYAGQYQQRPVPLGGAIFHDSDWQRYTRESLPPMHRVVAFADTAHKTGREHDYTAIALWGEAANGWFLLDLVWGRWEFPDLLARITATWDRWRSGPAGLRPSTLVVEDASSGTAIIQTIQTQTRIPVASYRADRDKVSRAYAVSNLLAAGKLFVPASDAEGVGEFDVQGFVDEHTVFPRGMHDDRVDTTTMALLYLYVAPGTRAMPPISRELFAGVIVHMPQQRRSPRR